MTTSFPLLASKLFPGVGTRHPLARPRLAPPEALFDGRITVVSIVAPAGYGKSTLMASWHALLGEAGVGGGWISLDEDDNDAGRFLRYLVAALQGIDAALGAEALSQLGAEGMLVPLVLLESIANDLSRVARRAVIFLDDLHCIDNPEVLRVVEWLVNYAPHHIQFVLGSREASGVRLGGLRVRGSLFELDQRRLAFDNDEAMRFCQARLQHQPAEHELRQLVHKTEGWPAGLELVTLALREEPEQTDLIEDFTGTDRGVVEYLGEVVLQRLDQDSRDFLYKIAQFDRISGALACAATGLADAQVRLQGLHARNLFLIALDREGVWFRFHHLVGDFFRLRVPDGPAVDGAGVLMAGARWLHKHGYVEDAINGALRAQAWEMACSWLADIAEDASHRQGAHHMLFRWMREIPQHWTDRYPAIGIHYAFSLIFSPRQCEADEQLACLEQMAQRLDSGPESAHGAHLRCAVELQRILLLGLRDEGPRTRALAQDWLQRWPQAGLLQLGSAENVLAFGHKSCGDIDASLAALERARGHLQRDAGYYGLVWNATISAIVHMKRGDYLAARAGCEAGLDLVRERLNGHGGHLGLFHVILAAIAYEFGDIDLAEKEIELGLVNIEESGVADILILAYLTQARLQFMRGDRDGGFAVLRQGQGVGRARELKRVVVTLAAEECTALCRTGDSGAAEELAHTFGLRHPVPVDANWDLHRDKSSRVGSRLMLRSAPSHVAAMLDSALAHCRRKGMYHRAVELLILQGGAWRYADQPDKARQALAEALALGTLHGYRRVFLDDLDLLRATIEPLAGMVLPDWLASALRQSGAAQRPDALTKRELRILCSLQSSLSNREIAESMFISEGTLKWHLHNIYGKLQARNRTGALLNARTLGLI
ncbi:MAG: LuxR C-terminal-related transcriptional regulator [Pseudomonadota bacterium]